MIFYLTYNDAYSGIYSSQVIDVVKYCNQNLGQKMQLVAFISIHDFFQNRRKIKNELDSAIVLPMFPGVNRWSYNYLSLSILSFFLRPKAIVARSVLAANLALKVRNKFGIRKVIYDGRGAIEAEWNEYKVVTHPQLLADIATLEKNAIHQSDFRIAVSNALIAHWQKHFNYLGHAHFVIPCTINKIFEQIELHPKSISNARQALGFSPSDLIFIYSGSVAGWQSFDVLNQIIVPILNQSESNKILFLSALDKAIGELQAQFPNQVLCKKVQPFEVPNYLILGDYGLLLREKSITNQVASPVKFAEYLACGLSILISKDLGDYSKFVEEEGCGNVLSEDSIFSSLEKPSLKERQMNIELAKKYFYKSSQLISEKYKTLVSFLY